MWNVQKLKFLVSVLEKCRKFLSGCFFKVFFSLFHPGHEVLILLSFFITSFSSGLFLLAKQPFVKFLFFWLSQIFKWVSDETCFWKTLHLLCFFCKHRALSLHLHMVATQMSVITSRPVKATERLDM